MSKLKFETSDFDLAGEMQWYIKSRCTELANARLAEMLKDCPVVYCSDEEIERDASSWMEKPYSHSKFKATLVNVEELPKPECAHEPDYRRILEAGDRRCVKCKVELKATWEAVK